MGVDQSVKIKIHGGIRIRHHHVFFFLIPQETDDAGQGLHTAGINLHGFVRIGRENMQTAVFTGQVPFTAGAEMVHQGMIISADDDGNISDAAVYHAGQNEVHHAVTAGKRDGGHQTFSDQLRYQRIIAVRENDAQCICVGIYHCSSPPFTLFFTMA